MAEEIVTTEINAEGRKFIAAMGALGRSARIAERQILDLIGTVNDFDKAMNTLKAAGLKLNIKVDSSALSRAEADVKSLDGMSASVDVQVDGDQLARAGGLLKEIDGARVEVDVTADTSRAEAAIQAVDDNAPSPVIQVDADTEKAENKIKNVDDNAPSPTIKVDADTSAVEAKLEQLKNIATLDLVLNLSDRIDSAPIISGVVSRDGAINALGAKTGLGDAEAAAAFNEVYTNAYGESAGEIANNIALVEQLDVATGTLASNTMVAWDTALIAGEDFSNVLEVMDKLVKTGLVKDFEQARDVIVGGLQDGTNRSNDFLDSLREYSSFFAAGGYSPEAAINLMNQALEQGTFNTDKLGDAVKENILKITEAVGDVGGAGGTAKPILEQYELLDEAALVGQAEELGGISAAQFAQMFLDKLNEEFAAGNIDTAQFNFALTEVFGTPVEDLGFEIFKGLDFKAAMESEGSFDGLGAEAAKQINDNLGTAFTGLGRTIETEIVATLADAGLDLNSMLDTAKSKVSELAALLRDGVALPDALEIVLQMPGLADTLKKIESVMGNVYIAFLDIVARGLDFVGDDQGAAGVRGTISNLAQNQLAFDIQLADGGEEIARTLQTALDRGVSTEGLTEALNTGIGDLINKGDVEAANELLATVQELPNAYATVRNELSGVEYTVPLTITPDMSKEDIQKKAEAALREQGVSDAFMANLFTTADPIIDFVPTIDTSGALTQVQTALSELDTLFQTALSSGDYLSALPLAQTLEGSGDARFAGLADSIKSSLEAAMNEATANGDWANAIDFASALEGTGDARFAGLVQPLQDSVQVALRDAMASENWTEAFSLAEVIGADSLTEEVQTRLDEARSVIENSGLVTEIDNTTLSAEEFQKGVELANTAAANTAKDGLKPLTTGFEETSTAADDTTLSIQDANLWMSIFGVTVDETMKTALGNMLIYAPELVEQYNAIRDAAIEASNAAGGINISGGSAQIIAGMRAGGGDIKPGSLYGVGEEGFELFFSNTPGSILPHNESSAFLAGMQASSSYWGGQSGGGGSTTYNDNRVLNVQTTNNNSGSAARMSGDERTARAVRGFN